MFCSQRLFYAGGVMALTAALLTGCTEEQEAPREADNAATPEADNAASESDTADLDPEIEKALASLSPADREAALAQKVCPVSGEPLGAMGTPRKITVEGREVFICCEGCDEKLRANPEEYLAKLPEE